MANLDRQTRRIPPTKLNSLRPSHSLGAPPRLLILVQHMLWTVRDRFGLKLYRSIQGGTVGIGWGLSTLDDQSFARIWSVKNQRCSVARMLCGNTLHGWTHARFLAQFWSAVELTQSVGHSGTGAALLPTGSITRHARPNRSIELMRWTFKLRVVSVETAPDEIYSKPAIDHIRPDSRVRRGRDFGSTNATDHFRNPGAK